jgi:hypothetical protein
VHRALARRDLRLGSFTQYFVITILSVFLVATLHIGFEVVAETIAPQGSSKIRSASASASIISRFETTSDLPLPRWCYDSVPAFIVAQGRSLLRVNTEGAILQRIDLDYPIAERTLSCSRDGRTISFLNAKEDRIAIVDRRLNARSVYALDEDNLLHVRYGSLMSPDGSMFALPGEPALVSGPDILREKVTLRVDNPDVFWTKDLLFARQGRTKSMRLYRLPTFSDTGLIEFPAKWLINSIYDCSGMYYVSYIDDENDQQYLQQFNLGPLRAGKANIELKTKYGELGEAQKDYDTCSISIAQERPNGIYGASKVILLSNKVQIQVTTSKLALSATPFAASKDMSFLLTGQPPVLAGRHNPGNVLVLQIHQ